MSIRWLLIASVVLIALSAFYAGVIASDSAHAYQRPIIVGVLVFLMGLAISVIWKNYPQ
jgi:uncharacterized membrane protein (DUF485 family)